MSNPFRYFNSSSKVIRLDGAGGDVGRFLPPLLRHLATAGLGHVSEVADGNSPHVSRGCPFQAWSLRELIRMRRLLGDAVPPVPA